MKNAVGRKQLPIKLVSREGSLLSALQLNVTLLDVAEK
jgi:hypothetical protein